MRLQTAFTKTLKAKTDIVVVPLFSGLKKTKIFSDLDKKVSGLLSAALEQGAFEAKQGETFVIPTPAKAPHKKIILLGLGEAGALNAMDAEDIGGKLLKLLQAQKLPTAQLVLDDIKVNRKLKADALAAHIAMGVHMRSYVFHKYKSKKEEAAKLKSFDVAVREDKSASALFKEFQAVLGGMFWARDLVNEPPSHLYPDSYAQDIKAQLKPLGVKVEILDEKKMEKLGMGAILAVGQGSIRKPRMVIMRWEGGKAKSKKKSDQGPIAFVGKGVTFDTGGISIKPSNGMEDMKMDMGGSAAVVGLMKSLALRKSKSDVVAVVGLAENMPGSNAYRPADILTSLSGKTIEVLNTDAEGRLVLADCLTHVQQKYKPRLIIDLATLTGAMMVALGFEYCGTFSNDDALWRDLDKASAETGEKLWRMPLDPVWSKEMESQVADLQNLGSVGRWAGACTAAEFLHHFIDNDTPWAHMDIAGTAWSKRDRPTVPKFGTGFGVRVLDRFVADNYEEA